MSWHTQPFSFYFKNIVTRLNANYFLSTLIFSIPFFVLKKTNHKQTVIHLFIIILVYLMVISIPSVKLEWYDAPIYPLWSMALAIMLNEIILIANDKFQNAPTLSYVFHFFIILFISINFYSIYSQQLLAKRDFAPQEKEAVLLKQIDNEFDKQNYTILMDIEDNKLEHFGALKFYIKAFKLNQHKKVIIKRYVSEVKSNDTLLVVQKEKFDSLKTLYEVKELKNVDGNYVMIKERK